ncbi:hypothetical protein MLD38_002544 [Melastoma candidum]|uniref:Uncharacterized protein n=1 Tax=Melastoma candidum TaxID=119954 RepID=A0ACB9S3F2_9MYRT|nr:hypothetical protein MLD38_002544 [Melastoma candidum]
MSVGGSLSAPANAARRGGDLAKCGGSGFDPEMGVYRSLNQLNMDERIPTAPELDIATFVFSFLERIDWPESRFAFIDASTDCRVPFKDFHRSVRSLAAGLYHALGVRKGDVVFVLAPNSIMYPTICLGVLYVGAVLTTANPLNTASEIAKQIADSGAKIAISAPEELPKLVQSGILTVLTRRTKDEDSTSVEELIECCDPVDLQTERPTQSDTAAILYSSGTTGVSKGVVLTHHNLISVVSLLGWSVRESASQDDTFLCFIPMFHIYGLAFFVLGLICSGITTVVMERFDLQAMIKAIRTHKVNNIAAVPPVILALVKYASHMKHDLPSLRRVGSGAAPLSKEISDKFRKEFPWVELAQGYGLTESSGAATFFSTGEEAKMHPRSCGRLLPEFSSKVVDPDTGSSLPPYKEGELWLKGPTIMKGYLGNEEATQVTLNAEGWLKTGDLCYIDGDGYVHVVDRMKELIKHNGYQVAPAELEAVLLSHPEILDSAVIPIEDAEAGQSPMAYVVKKGSSNLTEEQVIRFVTKHVAPYKKVRKVRFISTIPKSAAGKILRKELISQSQQQLASKL